MKKIVEKYFCDICGADLSLPIMSVSYPVIFHTEQDEGRNTDPYISQQKLDICESCKTKILKLNGWGAQGHNKFKTIP